MPNITDGAIRAAIKRATRIGKQISLTDGEGRGTGRLALIVKPMPRGITADWMIQQWRGRKRIKAKIGSYPAMGLADAREVFQRDFSGVILKGSSIKTAFDTRPGSVADLFVAYVNHLKINQKSSWQDAESALLKVAAQVGNDRAARDLMTCIPNVMSGLPGLGEPIKSAVSRRVQPRLFTSVHGVSVVILGSPPALEYPLRGRWISGLS